MRTDELIALLSAGAAPAPAGMVWRRLAIALAAGVVLCGLLLLAVWGVRPDLSAALQTRAFWMKAGYAAALGVGGLLLLERTGRPGARFGIGVVIIIVAVAMLVSMASMDLMRMPSRLWPAAWLGQSWLMCPWRILAISIPAFIASVWALRRLAPTRLRLAGAAAGLFAGGIGAAIYGLYCQETTAPFVATWYTLGIALCAAIGGLLGPRLLRW